MWAPLRHTRRVKAPQSRRAEADGHGMRIAPLALATSLALTVPLALAAPSVAQSAPLRSAASITTSATRITHDTLRDPVLRGTAPAGSRLTLQVDVRGAWKANQRFTVPRSGTYAVRLTYGRGAVGTFRHRLTSSAGAVGPVVTLRRAAVLNPTIRTTTRADVAKTWRPGCPVHHSALRTVEMNHWGFDGRMHRGRLVLAAGVTTSALQAFQVGIDTKFPIQRMREVSAYAGNDDRSMAANNTSAFNCRRITNGTGWSKHSYGRAIDINPVQNPYIYKKTVSPAAGKAYTDRRKVRPGMMVSSAPLTRAFTTRGWKWLSAYDYQHVEK